MGDLEEFEYSIYLTSQDEEGRKELETRPVVKDVLIEAMSNMKLEGEWRITPTTCGLIISFKRDRDLLIFQEADLSSVLGVEVSAYSYCSQDTYRQKLMIRGVPWMISMREVDDALVRQGIFSLLLNRTRQGNIVVEVGDPTQFNTLMTEGFNFYSSARFPTIPFPNMLPMPPPVPMGYPIPRDSVLQCYKCQGFWHYAAHCTGSQRCVRCGEGHTVSECPRPRNDPVCVHCAGRHHAAYRHCPVRLQMTTILPPLYMQNTPYFTPHFV